MLAAMMAAGGAAPKQYVDDVFSAWTYTGNGSTQTITNGIDLAGKGGLVWVKCRSSSYDNGLMDTVRGTSTHLRSNSTAADTAQSLITNYNSNGFSLNSFNQASLNGGTFASWTFRNADRFFTHTTKSHTNGVADTIDLSSLGTVGMVLVKGYLTGGDNWKVFHRSATTGKLLYLNLTQAETTDASISISGTTLTLAASLPTDTYVVYAWAHDSSADGIIQCGSFTAAGDGSASVTTGWEPQLIEFKSLSAVGDWWIEDSMRGMPVSGSILGLKANASNAEIAVGGGLYRPSATGFYCEAGMLTPGTTYVYLAIRRPNKPPTTGTQVYNAVARTGTSGAATVTGVGFAPDSIESGCRNATNGTGVSDRLRGSTALLPTYLTDAESVTSDSVTAFGTDGVTFGADSSYWFNKVYNYYIYWFFRRAPGVYDKICHKGSGANKTEPHTLLGVPPELWRTKRRDSTGSWVYGSSLIANTEKVVMPSPNGRVTDATAWNSTYPTASQISFGTLADVNASGGTYITEMWATKPGISKVGKYTGNGSSQNIDCGFTGGARYVKIIRLTAGTAQDIFVFDTVRGIVAANDPHLSLNTAAAEVTTDDSVDPYAAGFAVNQNSATNINVNGADYLFLAYA